jgi:hypothetical protein
MSHGQSDLKVTYLVFRLMKNIIFNKGNAKHVDSRVFTRMLHGKI